MDSGETESNEWDSFSAHRQTEYLIKYRQLFISKPAQSSIE